MRLLRNLGNLPCVTDTVYNHAATSKIGTMNKVNQKAEPPPPPPPPAPAPAAIVPAAAVTTGDALDMDAEGRAMAGGAGFL
jgi:hypothetical protein